MKRASRGKIIASMFCVAFVLVIARAECTSPNFTVTEFQLPLPALAVAVGDFNRDGKDDVAIPDNTQVQILLSNGAGGFQTPILTAAGAGPKFVAVGDFDSDGKADLAVAAGTATNEITFLKGVGNGKFSPLSTVNLGTNIWSNRLAVGDVNNDGDLDVVTANFNSSYSVLTGDGSGNFAAHRTQMTASPGTIRLADVNRNGSLDIVFTDPIANQVVVLLGNGNGTFGSPSGFAVGTQPSDLVLGDFNRDGRLDVVTANENSNSFSLLLGNGLGGFATATNFSEAGHVEAIVAADFNGDGRLDVADSNTNYGSPSHISVRFGRGNGSFDPPVDFAITLSSSSLAVGKFGVSCKPDLVASISDVSRMPVLFNNCP